VPVLDPHVDRRVGLAVDHDGVIAGRPQLGAPPAAGLGLAVAAGERRLRRRGVPVGAREREPVDDAGREHELVLGSQRLDARREVPQQEVAGEGAAPEVPPEHRLRDLLDAGLTGGEVDVEQLSDHARWHRRSSLE